MLNVTQHQTSSYSFTPIKKIYFVTMILSLLFGKHYHLCIVEYSLLILNHLHNNRYYGSNNKDNDTAFIFAQAMR